MLQVMRQHFENRGLSRRTVDIITASWRASTCKQYQVYITQWRRFCHSRNTSYLQAEVETVLEFLSSLFHDRNLSYSAINTARSALSTFLILVDSNQTMSTHPLITRLMRGVFQLRPVLPRYTEIWNISPVLNFLRKLSPVNSLNLRDLTLKVCMLMALVSAQRVQTLHILKTNKMTLKGGFVVFHLDEHLKQSKPGNTNFKFKLEAYPPDRRLCIVKYVKHYVQRTGPLRGNENSFFVSYTRPHNRVTTQTLSRWIKTCLQRAGVDTNVYKAHSTRAASTSAAAKAALPMDQILARAGWSSEKTFRKFYRKPFENKRNFTQAVLQDSTLL